MCEYIEGGINIDEDGGSWAREFFDEVASARQAIERAEALGAWRKTAPYAGETVDDEDDEDDEQGGDAYAWARDVLEAFDQLAGVQRAEVRGDLLEGLDIAEAKYRLGMKSRAIAGTFHVSNDTMYRRIAAVVDYLNALGPEQAFSAEPIERAPVGFEAPPKTRAEMLEDAGIMPAPEDLEAMMYVD